MSDIPPDAPHHETVRVDRTDIEVIIEGLREMPNAMTLMAGSIQVLAENTNKATTKSYTAAVVMCAALLNVLVLGFVGIRLVDATNSIKSTQSSIQTQQSESAVRGKDIQKTVDKVADCLDILDTAKDSTPPGECAKLLLDALNGTVEDIRVDLQCTLEDRLRSFIALNADPEKVQPPPLSAVCVAYFKEHPNN